MKSNNPREVQSFCRICTGSCGMTLTVDENDYIVKIRGDKNNPLTKGYNCIKGLQANDILRSPKRLLHPLKRQPDGSYEKISAAQAITEIAARLKATIDERGPNALAAYRGTNAWFDAITHEFTPQWLRSFGSYQFYSTVTIDQSSKWVSAERLGSWSGGAPSLAECDVVMFVGANPLVSLCSLDFAFNPTLTIKAAKERGVKFIVIDPRKTETARYADVFLQTIPGEDATLAAGMLNIILTEKWHDEDFCKRFVSDLAALKRGVAPFTPAYVEKRTGVSIQQIRDAAECFAKAKRAMLSSGTGPSMANNSNLAIHLYDVIAVVCGHFRREGEQIPNPGVMKKFSPRREEVLSPRRRWMRGPKSRKRGFGTLMGEMMSGELANEILEPGEGQIRSLFVVSGNPASVIPDTNKIVRALKSLDLLVVLDREMSDTAKLADYVLPPTLLYEVSSLPLVAWEAYWLPVPYAQYAEAAVAPPKGSDVRDDWYWLWAIADAMGHEVSFNGVPIEKGSEPSTDDMLKIRLKDSSVPFDEIKRHTAGQIYDLPKTFVQPGNPESSARFDVIPDDVADELAQLLANNQAAKEKEQKFTHRLVVRRMRSAYNSQYRDVPALNKRAPYNPAFAHPEDLAEMNIEPNQKVAIVSAHGRVDVIIKADDSLRQGVVTLTHGYGRLPSENAAYESNGVSVNLILSQDEDYQTINAMPRMSSVPIRFEPAG